MEEKKVLNEEELEKVNGGEIQSANIVGYGVTPLTVKVEDISDFHPLEDEFKM